MKYLNKISSPGDVKRLGAKFLPKLAEELRQSLLENVSKTGGHLASNLGVVELTVALHYCFDFPEDKIIWDVGHQSYIHKMLTGRLGAFHTLRQHGGLSGFPKCGESEYDAFETGHSSTAISAALGFAKARDIRGSGEKIVAVVGDGSITGGLAFEAMNNAGHLNSQFLVVLNDNEMSISENVGALSTYLSRIRTAPGYIGAKRDVNRLLGRIPVAGKGLARIIEKGKDSLKYVLMNGAFFDELGFTYVGPIDGHDINGLIEVFKRVKDIGDRPVLLHVLTKKGKGYAPAEKHPEWFHGVDSFELSTGKPLSVKSETYSDVFGKAVERLGESNRKIVAITAAMLNATGLAGFAAKFPQRIFDVGIAEAHAVTFAAGLAKNGLVPVFAVYSSFLQRAYDQILHDVCLQNLPVIFAIDRAGVVGRDGETHQGVFDLSFLSHLPNMTVMAPKDGQELDKMLEYAVLLGSPVAIRYPRDCAASLNYEWKDLEYGKSELLRGEGRDAALVSVGSMAAQTAKAYDILVGEGTICSHYNARFIKPADDRLVRELAEFGRVFSIEDNIRIGGYGASLLERANALGLRLNLEILAFPDEFIAQGTREQILEGYGLAPQGIANAVRKKSNV